MSRIGGFSGPDEPLDQGGRRAATVASIEQRYRAHVVISPARSAGETAAAMKLAATVELALADCDHGTWAGRTFANVHEATPDEFAAWLADPTSGAPDGEAMIDVVHRISPWLDRIAREELPICAITHPTIIRAALAYALDIPLRSTLAIDIAPLSRTSLSFNRRWRLQGLEGSG